MKDIKLNNLEVDIKKGFQVHDNHRLCMNYSENLVLAAENKETVFIQNIVSETRKIRVTFYCEDINEN